MTVTDFIAALQKFARSGVSNGQAEIMLKLDDDMCVEFNDAQHATGMPGQNFLVLTGNVHGQRIEIREVRMM